MNFSHENHLLYYSFHLSQLLAWVNITFFRNRNTNDTFFSIVQLYDQIRFRDTIQTKAYPFDSLVGNMGGYMGLLLGYSLVQVPNFIELMAGVIMRRKSGKLNTSEDRVKSIGTTLTIWSLDGLLKHAFLKNTNKSYYFYLFSRIRQKKHPRL